MKIIVSIPAFNEEKTISNVIKSIKQVMEENKYNYNIQIVDDGSSDNTSEIVKKLGIRVIKHPINYGLAETFRTELKEFLDSDADIFVHIDADGQYSSKDIPKLINKIKEGYDLVLGSRFKGKIESMPIVKIMGNKAFSRVVSNISGLEISDTQTGFRAFTREVASRIKIISNHTYTQEQIIKAVREKFKIIEVPIYFAKRKGKSRLIRNPFEYAIKAWINLIRIYRDYEPLKLFGRIGLFLLSIVFIIGLYFIYLHFTEGIKGHLGLFLFTILLFFSGLQIIIFGLLADMNKK